MSRPQDTMLLAVALDGAGWHPAAWREPDARPQELFTARYWTDLVQEAERGQLDFVSIDDTLAIQSPRHPRTDQVRGRLGAVLIAARVAPLTTNIGLIPTAVVTHTEPFHLSKEIATLDYVSTGRAGVQVRVSGSRSEAALFGRRTIPDPADVQRARLTDELFAEAGDYVEVLRRLWDSWEDDAEIRDLSTGRFVDRDKLHYIDFAGEWFHVRGPSITPRPPQGQPIVAALAHQSTPYRFAGTAADLAFVTPRDADHARAAITEIHTAAEAAGRADPVHVVADLLVFLDNDAAAAAERKARLDERAGAELRSDATVFTGTPAGLADLLVHWRDAGLSGFRLRPATIPHDLTMITRALVPELQRRGLFHTAYPARTLRGLLGMARPANRYAA